MTQQAAVDLDVEISVLDLDPSAPAVMAGARHVAGDPDAFDDLARLAAESDVVTFDHELVPNEAIVELERAGHTVRPGSAAKELAQDKHVARRRFEEAGFPVPRWARVSSQDEVAQFAERGGWPLVLKLARGGYDGRGFWMVDDLDAAGKVIEMLPEGAVLLAEVRVEIVRELAALVARRPSGEVAPYPVVETVQRDGICTEVLSPASCSPDTASRAQELAVEIAETIGATGMLAVEMFETSEDLLVNELALRPHNSGHVTLDAFQTSQFENHLRGVLDWPLGATGATVPAAAMVNLLGPSDGSNPETRLRDALAVHGARVRLYGKEARPGRKLGHVTALGKDVEDARGTALAATRVMSDA